MSTLKIIWNQDKYGNACAYQQIKVPGVTTVIGDMLPSPELDKWREDVGEEAAEKIMKFAAWRGTAMHVFIENWLIEMKKSGDHSAALKYTQQISVLKLEEEGVPKNKIDEGRKLFYNFLESSMASSYSKLLGTETAVYSPKLFYRGKIDWLYEQSLYGLSVSDFKTSSSIIEKGSEKEEKYKYQIGSYGLGLDHMLKERDPNTTQKVNYASIISVHTNSNLVQNIALYGDELQEYKDKFESLVREYHIKHGQEYLLNG